MKGGKRLRKWNAKTADDVEVISSTFDEPGCPALPGGGVVIDKRQNRLVEYGHDVVILLDSITRLARAYNSEMPHSGKILTRRRRCGCNADAEKILRCGTKRRERRVAYDIRNGFD